MHIVRALLDGPLGFNELGRAVGGCNPATLKVRLDHLEDSACFSEPCTRRCRRARRTSSRPQASTAAGDRCHRCLAREHLDIVAIAEVDEESSAAVG